MRAFSGTGASTLRSRFSPSTNSTADGSLYFSILDMAKWDAALYTDTPLTQASRNKIWTPARLSDGTTKGYGFGWHILDLHGHRLIVHGGAWQGFSTYIVRYPADRLTVAVLCNRAGASAGYIAKRIGGFYVPSAGPRVQKPIKLDPAILSSYVGDYRLQDRFTIKVTSGGDRLETIWLGEKITLVPESESNFSQEDSDRTFRFVKDASGNVTSLIVSVPEELVLQRVR